MYSKTVQSTNRLATPPVRTALIGLLLLAACASTPDRSTAAEPEPGCIDLSGRYRYSGLEGSSCTHEAKLGFWGLPIPWEDGYHVVETPSVIELDQASCEQITLRPAPGTDAAPFPERTYLAGAANVTMQWQLSGFTHEWKGKPKGPRIAPGKSRVTATLSIDLTEGGTKLRYSFSHLERGAALLLIPFKNESDLTCWLERVEEGPVSSPAR